MNWIINQFEKFYIPKRNLTYERYIFFTRDQRSEENIENYTAELRKLEKLRDSLIRDRIIIGMKDDGLRQRFLQENSGKEIALNKVVNAIKVKETSKEQMKLINSNAERNIYYIDKKRVMIKILTTSLKIQGQAKIQLIILINKIYMVNK